MGWLDRYIRIEQADESWSRIIIPAYSVEWLIDDIREDVNWNLTFGMNAIHKIQLDKYRDTHVHTWIDRQHAKYILECAWKYIPEWLSSCLRINYRSSKKKYTPMNIT